MATRAHTLIDFTAPAALWPDLDRVVRFKEYVRLNFAQIVTGVPIGCEVDLFASGHPHNPGLVPQLGLWSPPHLVDQLPDPFTMVDEVDAWCLRLTAAEVQRIVTTTAAPTWEELVRIRIHPPR